MSTAPTPRPPQANGTRFQRRPSAPRPIPIPPLGFIGFVEGLGTVVAIAGLLVTVVGILGIFKAEGVGRFKSGTVAMVAFLVFFGAISAATWAYQKKKRAWMRYCHSRGWTFSEDDPHGRARRLSSFAPFHSHPGGNVEQVVTGTHLGVQFELFQYEWETGSGKSRSTHRVRVAVCPMPLWSPGVRISAETFGKKVRKAMGGEDIDVESDEFSKRFWVTSSDRKFAYDFLHPPMVEQFLRIGNAGEWHWLGNILLWTDAGKLRLEHLEPLVGALHGIQSNLPRHAFAAQQAWMPVQGGGPAP